MPIIDAHTHGTGYLPRAVDAAYRLITRPHPHDVELSELQACGVDAVVAKAVGDGVVTRWHLPRSAWTAVQHQLASIRAQADAGQCRVITDPDEIGDGDRPAVILGLEGGDVVGNDPARLDDLHALGVRVIGLVHYVDNGLGTVCMPWQKWVPGLARVPLGAFRRSPGLTPIGAEVIARMNELGMVIDLAHADRETTLAACELTTGPVLSSHTGARALQDFARFLSDDEVRAVAATGGLVGLWPFRYRGRGARDIDDWVRHAGYLAELVGAEHLCIGTDMNGVSGLMDGYRGEEDLPLLFDALRTAGFSASEVAGISGDNLFALLKSVCGSGSR